MSALSFILPEFPRGADRRISYAEHVGLVEQGFFGNDKVELVDGQMPTMSPRSERHNIAVLLTRQAFERAYSAGQTVPDQMQFGFP